ncbi:Receptor-like protein 12 [Ananas comosus]|uniref:Receptor-like protein 12 n=1 Tax=Ananas comosus TaxID=4615 RepID=A0A199VSU3_ANACO|nr:Receptor-like protein 12 [Ananas comosus]
MHATTATIDICVTDVTSKVPISCPMVRRPQAYATLLNLYLTLAMKPLGQKHSIQAFAASGCFETERNALLAFKTELIDPRNRLVSWKSQNCCTWKGVVCNNTTGHILKLNLRNSYDNNDFLYYRKTPSALGGSKNFKGIFDGNLPFALCESASLQVLDVSNNKLSGEIPSCLGMSQDQLLVLDVMNNTLSGKVPTSLGELRALSILDLSNNRLSGEIPSSLQYCTQTYSRSNWQDARIGVA